MASSSSSSNTAVLPPSVAQNISPEDLAVISIYDQRAAHENRDTPYMISPIMSYGTSRARHRSVVGANVFLRRTDDRAEFNFGRKLRSRNPRMKEFIMDVYLPGSSIAQRQFSLHPDWEADCWYLQSHSQTAAIVDDIEVQMSTPRTRKSKKQLPQYIYLSSTTDNHITVGDLYVTIRILKHVRHGFIKQECPERSTEALNRSNSSNFTGQDRYILTRQKVSSKSRRVIEKFTGEVFTVKMFEGSDVDRARRLRDREFLAFRKDQVDTSIVQYLQKFDLNSIPAILTATHLGFVSYGTVQSNVQKLHLGARFKIARKLLRRLCSALAFLHFHGIVHGGVNAESVILRRKDGQPDEILLVDYSSALPFITGARPPKEALTQDARAAMMLVESCCTIWTLRKGASIGAVGEQLMESRTQDAMLAYQKVQRVASDYFERQGNSRDTVKGKKLTKLLLEKTNDWQRAQTAQAYNVTLREVGMMSKAKIDSLVQEWHSNNAQPKLGEKEWMIVSLGQKWLDDLANSLYQNEGKRWDLTPTEICAKIKELGGPVEDPWQTFDVILSVTIEQNIRGFDEVSLLSWLASCHDRCPEWQQALRTECEQHLRSADNVINGQTLARFLDALSVHGELPASMANILHQLVELASQGTQLDSSVLHHFEEVHRVHYHVPSRLFNITRLQQLAAPDLLALAISNEAIQCDDFVEVRGEPCIQGHYAPVTLLQPMAAELRLALPKPPKITTSMPTFDAADFSQVKPGLIVLAQVGLLGFATTIRSGDQCNFLEPKLVTDFETGHAFLPTYFGDMKVLASNIRRHERASHWSKFKTADEFEAGAGLNTRKILQMSKPSLKGKARADESHDQLQPSLSYVNESAISKFIKKNESIRASVEVPIKRSMETDSIEDVASRSPKRARSDSQDFLFAARHRAETTSSTQAPSLLHQHQQLQSLGLPGRVNVSFANPSFRRQNAGLFITPPNEDDLNQSFTVADDTEGLEDDQAEVDAMLAHMQDSDHEGEVQGLTGFVFHGSLADTIPDSPSPPRDQGPLAGNQDWRFMQVGPSGPQGPTRVWSLFESHNEGSGLGVSSLFQPQGLPSFRDPSFQPGEGALFPSTRAGRSFGQSASSVQVPRTPSFLASPPLTSATRQTVSSSLPPNTGGEILPNISHVSTTPVPTSSFHRHNASIDDDDRTSVATEEDMRDYSGVGDAIAQFQQEHNAAMDHAEDLPDTDGGSTTEEETQTYSGVVRAIAQFQQENNAALVDAEDLPDTDAGGSMPEEDMPAPSGVDRAIAQFQEEHHAALVDADNLPGTDAGGSTTGEDTPAHSGVGRVIAMFHQEHDSTHVNMDDFPDTDAGESTTEEELEDPMAQSEG